MSAAARITSYCANHSRFARFFATNAKQKPIKVGDPLPNVRLYEGTPDQTVMTHDIFRGKKGVLFAVPGAFIPGCSRSHIPEYLGHCESYRKEGYEEVVCLSVNDPFVMDAWGHFVKSSDRIRMLSDMKCEFTNATNMQLDSASLLGNIRSRRYFLLINDNVVEYVSHEPEDTGLSCLLCIKRMKPKDMDEINQSMDKKDSS
ncbi:hypothetical protein CAPTEDRAFT_153829 [Capitella teleta]|uniref:Peroxiredoxin-5 n=1 Tax=Capitella teleta TaxID=283909 RepID=R7UWP5_CAPTE|nr:hypothetical protein CAPTEDRAFT_153829 [Capitella teleta]|eukprot:ELU07831.1 hypothetical protein CAPTEDRAFT_153829 [Capitella teleta]